MILEMVIGFLLALSSAEITAEDLATPEADFQPENAASPELRAAIQAADAEHFRQLWEVCESAEKQGAHLHPDGEFYHEVNGARPYAGPALAFMARRCEAQAKSGERTRRELVEDSFTVDPVPGFGAIATGEHRFYSTALGEKERYRAIGRFLILWKQEPVG